MTIGFVLINVSPRTEKKVFDTMMKCDEIQELYPLFGSSFKDVKFSLSIDCIPVSLTKD
jgi:hypothetical protein